MLLVFLFLIGVIVLMMDCAKKSMKKKTSHKANGNPPTHSWVQPQRSSRTQSLYAAFAEPVPSDFVRSA